MRKVCLVPLILLSGCGGPASNDTPSSNDTVVNEGTATGSTVAKADAPADTVPSPSRQPSAPSTPAATPVDAPLAEGPFAPDSAQAAADVVQRYHALIESKRYRDAYRLWEPQAVGLSEQAFAASFAKYADYHAQVGAPGRIDPGAGQRYVTVPVKAYGRLAGGGNFALEGPFILHRVADIDGSTAEQRRWRIRSSDLKPHPAAGDPDSARATRYRCIDGSRLAARFDSAGNAMTLRRDGVRIGVLRRQTSGSGLSFKGAGYELRGNGDAATFSAPGRPAMACRAIG